LPKIGLGVGPVDLVGNEQDRPTGGAQPRRNRLIIVNQSSGGINQKQHQIRSACRGFYLSTHLRVECGPSGHPPAGVDHIEVVPAPFDLTRMAIARYSGSILDDRRLFTDETIEQRALADIGSTDDDDAFSFVALCHLVQATETFDSTVEKEIA
jgi:hypothetical protein